MLQCVLANVLSGAVADQQELRDRYQASCSSLDERLRQHGGERHRQFLADRVLSLHRKAVGDSRDRRGRVGRMNGREHEVARFGRRQRDSHRLGIAHLTNDDDVWRLAQGRTKRRGEIWSVVPDLDLFDHAPAMRGARNRPDLPLSRCVVSAGC